MSMPFALQTPAIQPVTEHLHSKLAGIVGLDISVTVTHAAPPVSLPSIEFAGKLARSAFDPGG
jgi:hypothetical protein